MVILKSLLFQKQAIGYNWAVVSYDTQTKDV